MGVMPYQFEKGLFPTLLEDFFNKGLDELAPTAGIAEALSLPGPAARLRAIWRFGSVARFLRERPANPGQGWLEATAENSFIRSSLFPVEPPQDPGMDFQRTVAVKWLGMTVQGEGPTRTFHRADPGTWEPGATIGHWNGYYGNVELIVCETVQRMLEVSLGLDHVKPPKVGVSAAQAGDIEAHMRSQVTRVWPIYMFLTCPKPWFEGWITWQRHSKSHPELRGQVTVILATPGHERPVAPSPVDLVGDVKKTQGLPNPYYLHGLEVPADGYAGPFLELVPSVADGAVEPAEKGADPSSSAGAQGMWVVTHANHDSTIVWSSFSEVGADQPTWNPGQGKPEIWDLPPIAAYRPRSSRNGATLGGAHPRTRCRATTASWSCSPPVMTAA